VVPSSGWWMCLALAIFNMLQNIRRDFSKVQSYITLLYESASGFFALRTLRSQLKLTQLSLTEVHSISIHGISGNGWVFSPLCVVLPPIAPFVLSTPLSLKITPKEAIRPTLKTIGIKLTNSLLAKWHWNNYRKNGQTVARNNFWLEIRE